jgi:hypothetical protein
VKRDQASLDRYKQNIEERVNAAAPDRIPATVVLRELRALGIRADIASSRVIS